MNDSIADGSLSVPPRQAGAEVFNCPDDYISISNVRLCGQKLNDGSVQVDFTKNYPVTGKVLFYYYIKSDFLTVKLQLQFVSRRIYKSLRSGSEVI